MSHELRQDPTTGRWVIVAPARGRRPGAQSSAAGGETPAAGPDFVPTCPFCPGNEESTPPEVYRLRPAGEGDGWRVRVVPNLFPAVAPATTPAGDAPVRAAHEAASTGPPLALAGAPMFASQPAVGYHEVVIETPSHSRHLADMDADELAAVLSVYRARYNTLMAQPGVRYVSLFRNHGREAGTSQPHPHAQLIALPMVPADVERRWDVAARHHETSGRCLYCDLLAAERASGSRCVLETGGFAAVTAYAPRFPFETWILPERHEADFGRISDQELSALARVLRRVLRALRDVLGDPPHNLVFQSKPCQGPDGAEAAAGFHWHLQIAPRTTRQAGFEIGTEMAIVPVLPEQAAAELRAALKD